MAQEGPGRLHAERTAGRPICKFHARGACLKSFACPFSHNLSANNGAAAAGNDSKKTPKSAKALEKERELHARRTVAAPSCRFFARGSCTRGFQCRFSHSTGGATGGASGASGSVNGRKKKSDSAAGRDNDEHENFKKEDEIENCGICFEDFRENGGRKVGLMESCDHHFCYKCILEWRGHNQTDSEITKDTQRACPMCRKTSHFVIPSARPLVGHDRKAAIKSFKKRCRSTPCRNWVPNTRDNPKKNILNRSCKLGHLCFYAHLTMDGKNAKPAQKRAYKKETKRRESLQRRRQMRSSGRVSPTVGEGAVDMDEAMVALILMGEMERHFPPETIGEMIWGRHSDPIEAMQMRLLEAQWDAEADAHMAMQMRLWAAATHAHNLYNFDSPSGEEDY